MYQTDKFELKFYFSDHIILGLARFDPMIKKLFYINKGIVFDWFLWLMSLTT